MNVFAVEEEVEDELEWEEDDVVSVLVAVVVMELVAVVVMEFVTVAVLFEEDA